MNKQEFEMAKKAYEDYYNYFMFEKPWFVDEYPEIYRAHIVLDAVHFLVVEFEEDGKKCFRDIKADGSLQSQYFSSEEDAKEYWVAYMDEKATNLEVEAKSIRDKVKSVLAELERGTASTFGK